MAADLSDGWATAPFYFEEVSAAFAAALEMSERAPSTGLPPTHIGIQAGPVVFRDGDVYGRKVNVASRIAERAESPCARGRFGDHRTGRPTPGNARSTSWRR